MTNLLQKYKTYTQKLNSKYYHVDDEFFQPYFSWNLFDTRNHRQPEWLAEYMYGWMGVGCTWKCWTYLMRDKKYSYNLPDAFWLELNNYFLSLY